MLGLVELGLLLGHQALLPEPAILLERSLELPLVVQSPQVLRPRGPRTLDRLDQRLLSLDVVCRILGVDGVRVLTVLPLGDNLVHFGVVLGNVWPIEAPRPLSAAWLWALTARVAASASKATFTDRDVVLTLKWILEIHSCHWVLVMLLRWRLRVRGLLRLGRSALALPGERERLHERGHLRILALALYGPVHADLDGLHL